MSIYNLHFQLILKLVLPETYFLRGRGRFTTPRKLIAFIFSIKTETKDEYDVNEPTSSTNWLAHASEQGNASHVLRFSNPDDVKPAEADTKDDILTRVKSEPIRRDLEESESQAKNDELVIQVMIENAFEIKIIHSLSKPNL